MTWKHFQALNGIRTYWVWRDHRLYDLGFPCEDCLWYVMHECDESISCVWLRTKVVYIWKYFSKTTFSPSEPLCAVAEFVPGGSLDKLLRKSRVQRCIEQEQPSYTNIWSRLTERQLLQIASDIANGMQYLESKLVSAFFIMWWIFLIMS